MNFLKTDRWAVFCRFSASGHCRGLLTLAWLVLMTLPGASLAQENHAPGMPGPIEVTEVTAPSARISWGASTDLDGDAITYWVSFSNWLIKEAALKSPNSPRAAPK
jgi:hypothetical protein